MKKVQYSSRMHFKPLCFFVLTMMTMCYHSAAYLKSQSQRLLTRTSLKAILPRGLSIDASSSRQEATLDMLVGLNAAQQAAVSAPLNSAVLCVAGPGSGKTKVLTHRIGKVSLSLAVLC